MAADDWLFQRELAYLSSPSVEIRCAAIQELGRMGDQRAVEPLRGLLKDRDWNVRFRAVEALGALGDRSVCVHIKPLLGDRESLVSCQAAIALGRLGDRSVADQLSKIAASGPNSTLRKKASEVLAALSK